MHDQIPATRTNGTAKVAITIVNIIKYNINIMNYNIIELVLCYMHIDEPFKLLKLTIIAKCY